MHSGPTARAVRRHDRPGQRHRAPRLTRPESRPPERNQRAEQREPAVTGRAQVPHQPALPDPPDLDHPRAYPAYASPHLPHRPLWHCRACADPWPCGRARLLLRSQYADRPADLVVYLYGALYAAAVDLYRLNPWDGPKPRALYDRFVTRTVYRQPE